MSYKSMSAQALWRTLAFCGLASLGVSTAEAKTLCVNPQGANSCYTTISAAVAAAAANDQIQIGPGEYTEDVVIGIPLVLVGAGTNSTIINARGLSNGIYVDGLDNPGLFGVEISGLTITNANFEGILVNNASFVVIANTHVVDNNQNLAASGKGCPGLPVFETSEAQDCGEGIHLMGVSFSTVANNEIELNSGGILLSDETAFNYENHVTGNYVHDNAMACGITVASHPPSPNASSKLPYGVVNNYISGNRSISNGRVGGGAGVGIFAPGPGNQAYGNQVVGNIIMSNGHPGISVHNHAAPPGAPGVSLNAIKIVGNYIAGNGEDDGDAKTPGTAGINIYGVAPAWSVSVIDNTIENQDVDLVMHNPGSIDAHMNNFLGAGVGIANLGTGLLVGSLNYFGCAGGPGATGCTTVTGNNVTITPALTVPSAPAVHLPSTHGGGLRP